jgi:hypothetical protein
MQKNLLQQKTVFNSVTQLLGVGGSPFILQGQSVFFSKTVQKLMRTAKIAFLVRGVALMCLDQPQLKQLQLQLQLPQLKQQQLKHPLVKRFVRNNKI